MSGRKRKAVTPWEACGESREDYEAWERREFAAALTSAGIDPTLEGAPLVDAMEAAGMLYVGARVCDFHQLCVVDDGRIMGRVDYEDTDDGSYWPPWRYHGPVDMYDLAQTCRLVPLADADAPPESRGSM